MDRFLTLNEIHKEQASLIEKFDEVCRMAGVNYFAFYGTLIGAIRHKGFIPWDDDVDVCMLADDFKKFLKYCETNADKLLPLKLFDSSNTLDYPFNIPRFCDTRYSMETDGYDDAGMGLFIDIYPLSGIGNSILQAKKYFVKRKRVYAKGYCYAIMDKFETNIQAPIKRLVIKNLYRLAKIIGRNYFRKRFNKLGQKYALSNSKYVSVLIWDRSFFVYEKEWFSEFEYAKFEDIKIKIPREYDKILTEIYGDYMKLPPEGQRQPTHSYKLTMK